MSAAGLAALDPSQKCGATRRRDFGKGLIRAREHEHRFGSRHTERSASAMSKPSRNLSLPDGLDYSHPILNPIIEGFDIDFPPSAKSL